MKQRSTTPETSIHQPLELNKEELQRVAWIKDVTAEQFIERLQKLDPVVLKFSGPDQKTLAEMIMQQATNTPQFMVGPLIASMICYCIHHRSIEVGVKSFIEKGRANGSQFPDYTVPFFIHFLTNVYPEIKQNI